MARAMRDWVLAKPKAVRVMWRIFVLVDSIRALDRPCSRVASMLARCCLMFLARRVNSGIRQRSAQDGHGPGNPAGRVRGDQGDLVAAFGPEQVEELVDGLALASNPGPQQPEPAGDLVDRDGQVLVALLV